MRSKLKYLAGAVLCLMLAAPPASARFLDADLDIVVRMPLAVADAYGAGVPAPELSELVGLLLGADVPPREFVNVVTAAPPLYLLVVDDDDADRVGVIRDDDDRDDLRVVRDRDADRDRLRERVRDERGPRGRGLGPFVQIQLDRGLRGQELAAAIHRELRRQGVPAGPVRVRDGVAGRGDRDRRAPDRDVRPVAPEKPKKPKKAKKPKGEHHGGGGPPGQARHVDRDDHRPAPPGQARKQETRRGQRSPRRVRDDDGGTRPRAERSRLGRQARPERDGRRAGRHPSGLEPRW